MRFHSDDYIDFLKKVSSAVANTTSMGYSSGNSNGSAQNTGPVLDNNPKLLHKYNVGEDCPLFDGLFEYCQISAGGSIAGAIKLNNGDCDYAVNWSGGLHHAKRGEASGFCYINDIVLAILGRIFYYNRFRVTKIPSSSFVY